MIATVETPPSLRLEELAWPEIDAAIAGGYRTVIVPCGAIEQHGPHLPLSVDAVHAGELAVEIAERLSLTLVAPVMPFGLSGHHLAFPGTISLGTEAYRSTLLDIFASLESHGFERILCFSGHIGNFDALRAISDEISRSDSTASEIRIFADREQFTGIWKSVVEELTGSIERVGCHADISETSIMLARAESSVRREKLAWGSRAPLNEDDFARLFSDGTRALSSNGILGDARGATPALGERLISEMADLIAESFRMEGSPR